MVAVAGAVQKDTITLRHRLADMTGGWVVGDFEPAVLRTSSAELAVKHLAAGARAPLHEQEVATEVTVVVTGAVLLAGHALGPGDILTIPPGTPAAFEALTDAVIVVFKTPSLPADKTLADPGA